MENYDIDSQSPVYVPVAVAKCPYCGDKLVIVAVDEWIRKEEGVYYPDHIEVQCDSQPDIEDENENPGITYSFEKTHYNMPYVNWMPVEEKVLAWFAKTYNFVRPQKERELLARWIEAARLARQEGKNER